MELWDAYRPDGSLSGGTLVRGEEIPEGLCHGVVEVFVIHEDGSILLMQRDKNKENYPGCWESGAGGSVLKGESFELGARRELLEETGILAGELEPIYKSFTKKSIYRGYFCRTNIKKDEIKLQEGETIDYKWVHKEEFIKIYESDLFVSSMKKRLDKFVYNDFVSEKDCCFTRGENWFRYRVGAVIIEEGCVLMARNDVDDYYYSIGGGVHMGESSQQAVIREVKEETGMDYQIDRLLFINEGMFYGDGSLSGRECHVVEFLYLMKPKGKREIDENSTNNCVFGEMPEYMSWIPIKELHTKKAFPVFFKDKLLELPEVVEHCISDERIKNE